MPEPEMLANKNRYAFPFAHKKTPRQETGEFFEKENFYSP